MTSTEKAREDIIKMQSWASSQRVPNKELLLHLYQVRTELEKMMIAENRARS
jgi:hypothetical protein